MDNDIERLLRNSSKAELLEKLAEELENGDPKVIVAIVNDKEGAYDDIVMTLGVNRYYEAYGILEVAKRHLQFSDFREDDDG